VENVNMRAYPQGVRHQVYQLFDVLLAGHRYGESKDGDSGQTICLPLPPSTPRLTLTPAFKAMGPEFISSYCKMVDGEKDPRNLMLLFQIDTVILREFNVAPQIEVSSTFRHS
jgi:DNA repair/transcription protein MET18/MMS19